MTPLDIKEIRKNLDMSQQQFADHIEVSISSIRAWEQGTRRITPRLARIVREASLRGNRKTIHVKRGEVITIIGG